MLGVTTLLTEGMYNLSGNDQTNLFFIFVPITSILSALMENVLAVTTFISVIHELGEMGVNNYPFWWVMLFSWTFFGNLTLIGSTANIVAIGMLERKKRGHIRLKEWIKPGAVISSQNNSCSDTSIPADPNDAKLKSFSIPHNNDDTKYSKFTQR